MSATLPSGNWHPLLWLGTLVSPVCLHVGLGSGANESSSVSAKSPIKRSHTWHFCAAGLRSASREEVSQAQAGRCSVSTEQQGWGPSDPGWLLPSLLSPSVQTSSAGIGKPDLVSLVPRIFFLEEPREALQCLPMWRPTVPAGNAEALSRQTGCRFCAQTSGAAAHTSHICLIFCGKL